MIDHMEIRGAKVHNLKNIDVDIPLNKIVAISGVSGSGKSSLALGVIYAEGSRRYLEALSTYTRRRISQGEKAKVDSIRYVPSTLALHQRPNIPGIRSTFGTQTELLNSIRLLFSRCGDYLCPNGHRVPASINVARGEMIECPICHERFNGLSAQEHAFNSQGACPDCQGTGIVQTINIDALIPDPHLTIDEIIQDKNSIIGPYLNDLHQTLVRNKKEIFNEGFLRLKTDTIHTVKPLDISIPKGVLTTITGMSGSGKTTLILESLYPAIKASLNHEVLPQHIKELDASWVNKVDLIDASPIGNNVRSTVATYSGVFDHLRRLYGRLSDQYSAGDFSYNTGKLRCPVCEGTGTISMDIQFLPDIEMTCEHCDGTRYSNDVDSIMYHGHSIKDVMSLTILEALDVFKDIKKIKEKLQILVDLGIGYLTLGEATPALSGGEAQRLKLASEIGKVQDGSIFIFDEPSIGLHPLDVETLLRVFDTLINQKATIIVIEHDLDVIRNSDYIIDMGPEGGQLGGEIIATGTVEEIKQNKNSKIGKYL